MCGRFDIDARNPEIRKLTEKIPVESQQLKLGEVFPGDNALSLQRGETSPQVNVMKWGWPMKDSKKLLFNARAETAPDKPFFSSALRRNPAAIPVTGFYEWRSNPLLKNKERFLFKNMTENCFFLAGFYREIKDISTYPAFVLLTTKANSDMHPYHQRMPVMLAKEEIEPWLDGTEMDYFLKRVQPPLKVFPQPRIL